MLCTDFTLVNHGDAVSEAKPLRCKSWDCDHCFSLRQWELAEEVKLGKPDKFLTLTIRRSVGDSPDHQARLLVWAWRILVRRIKKAYGLRQLPYMAVFEDHQSGVPHLHIALRGPYLPQSWLSRQMADLLDSPMVDIRKVRTKAGVAKYLAGYLKKGPAKYEGCKRYWKALCWCKPKKERKEEAREEAGTWEVVHQAWDQLVEEWKQYTGFLGVSKEKAWIMHGPPPKAGGGLAAPAGAAQG